MIELIIGIIITILIVCIPGYFIISFSSIGNNSFLERLYFGFVINFSILIWIGFILSYYSLFRYDVILFYMIIFNIILISLYFIKNRMIKTEYKTKITTNYYIGIIFVIVLLMALTYENFSPFPVGWDRGQHFGRELYLINNQHLPLTYFGSNYKPYYFEGPNLILSTLTVLSIIFSKISLDFAINDFQSIIVISEIFTFFFGFILALNVFAVYSLSKNIYNNLIGIISSLIFLLISGFDIVTAGTVGTNIAFLLISVFFIIIMNIFNKNEFNIVDYLFLFLIIGAICFTHIIGLLYMIIFVIFIISINVMQKKINYQQATKLILFLISSIIISSLFLLIFNSSLWYGIGDEIVRKNINDNSINEKSSSKFSLEYLNDNIKSIGNLGIYFNSILLFSILGFLFEIKYNRLKSDITPLIFTSLIFISVPILPFVRPVYYIMYPISIMAGLSLIKIFEMWKFSKFKNINKSMIMFLIFTLIIFGMIESINSLTDAKYDRQYYDLNTYHESYQMSQWLNENTDINSIILIPDAGATGFFISALTNRTVFFAEPRYSDMPLYQETSKLYLKFPTNEKLFDYSNLDDEEYNKIILRYNISVIIEDNLRKVNIDSIKSNYSEIQKYQPTPSYWVIILGDNNADSSD